MQSVAIIGAGFCGTMTAIHLLRAGGTHVTLFEKTGSFGPGLAYSTRSASHLLNVPAGRMSALPDVPDDFLRWGLAQGHHWAGGTFAPRREYGKYLQDALNAAEALGHGTLERITGEVVACRPHTAGVELAWTRAGADGAATTRVFTSAVLALGNFPPPHVHQGLAGLPGGSYTPDPWAAGALDGLDPTGPVLLVGTGLTMLDVVLSLVERGHRGTMHALSRRGLLPQPHRAAGRPPASHAPPKGWETWDPSAQAMLRNVRREVARAAKRGVDWREVITSLRSITPQLWQRLPERERGAFLRHLRPYWEVVRHRSAPSVDGQVQELMMSGRLHVHAARVASVAAVDGGGGVDVRIVSRGGRGERSLRVSRVINCTGPETDCRRLACPLVRQLIAEGLADADGLGQGLAVDDQSRLLSAAGGAWDEVRLIGPLAKGGAWEITAVPELREHAAKVAAALASRRMAAADVSRLAEAVRA